MGDEESQLVKRVVSNAEKPGGVAVPAASCTSYRFNENLGYITHIPHPTSAFIVDKLTL